MSDRYIRHATRIFYHAHHINENELKEEKTSDFSLFLLIYIRLCDERDEIFAPNNFKSTQQPSAINLNMAHFIIT